MNRPSTSDTLHFPFPEVHKFGEVVEVARGILWIRLPLPFRLDHVNIYLVEDDNGWAVVDTGIGDGITRRVWEQLMTGPLAGVKLTRIFVTHFHPDHIGLAGWLAERFKIPLLCSQTTYLSSQNISLNPGLLDSKFYHDFYLRHGMDADTVAQVSTNGHAYLGMVETLPPVFMRCVSGDTLRIGRRNFEVIAGNGHAPEQLMLYCRAEHILVAGDQVIANITPNVSVWAVDPEGDPLGLYLKSLSSMVEQIEPSALVLSGHQLPFFGLHTRCQQIINHHRTRCAMIDEACRTKAHSVADLVPVIFSRPLDAHQLGFAFSEVHAHVNYMVRQGCLSKEIAEQRERFVTTC